MNVEGNRWAWDGGSQRLLFGCFDVGVVATEAACCQELAVVVVG